MLEFEAIRTLLVIGVFLFAGYRAFVAIHNWVISTQEHIRRVEDQIAKANLQLAELNQKLTTFENLVKKLNVLENAVPTQVKEAVKNVKPAEIAKTGINVMAGIAAAAAAVASAPPGTTGYGRTVDLTDLPETSSGADDRAGAGEPQRGV